MTVDGLETIAKAIDVESVILFPYHKTGGEPILMRVFSPWEVTDDETNVIGWDHDKESIRKFAISNMGEPQFYPNENYARPAS